MTKELRRLGWRVVVVWECQTVDLDRLGRALSRLLSGSAQAQAMKEVAMPQGFPEAISAGATPAEAARYVRKLVRFMGPGFHPDERFQDYVQIGTGEPVLTASECKQLDRGLAMAKRILEGAGMDVYAISLQVARRLLSRSHKK